jgi:hypothetical protein
MRAKFLIPFAFPAMLSSVTPAHAVIMNGDFSNGLTDWTTEDLYSDFSSAMPSASISVVNGEAILDTQGYSSTTPFVEIVSLYQPVGIPADANKLKFEIDFGQGRMDQGGNGQGFPDFLEVAYYDDADLAYDMFLLGVDSIGFYDPNDPLGPTPMPDGFDPMTGLYLFSFDISSLAGRNGALYFDLVDNDDGYFSTGRVDNVWIGNGAVPEPGTWLLLTAGLAAAATMGSAPRRKSKRHGLP